MKFPRIRVLGWAALEFVLLGALLFFARYLARGNFVAVGDQECHIGGIAVDLLAHGIRFPPLAYAPNDYDNSALLSGILTAGSFKLFGQSVLARKLVTFAIGTAGSFAGLWLLRGCLDEAGIASRRARFAGISAYVLALALAPIPVIVMSNDAVGDHSEWSAMDVILLALFLRRFLTRSAIATAFFWLLAGFSLYISKGALLLVLAMGVAEIVFIRKPLRIAAAIFGFTLGVLPELYVIVNRNGKGWETILQKGERNALGFPMAWIDSVFTLAGGRVEVIVLWFAAMVAGALLAWRLRSPAVTLVAAMTLIHFGSLAIMGQGGMDTYCLYFFVTVVVLIGLLAAASVERASARWGSSAAFWPAAAALAIVAAVNRPAALRWEPSRVAALSDARAAAACSWRFAEGFTREYRSGLVPPGVSSNEHVIERCRTLTGELQRDDCIGGMARELHWRHGGRIDGEPPGGLTDDERRSYAWHYGIHRKGDTSNCLDFNDPGLRQVCTTAVQLDCLLEADMYTRMSTGRGVGRPECRVDEPPLDGYWSLMRQQLFAQEESKGIHSDESRGDGDLGPCRTILAECYRAAR